MAVRSSQTLSYLLILGFAGACGTAMFRACCFNYNRKRSLQLIPPQTDHTEQDNGGTQTLDGTLASLPNVIGLKQAVWRARKAGCAVDY